MEHQYTSSQLDQGPQPVNSSWYGHLVLLPGHSLLVQFATCGAAQQHSSLGAPQSVGPQACL